MNDYSFGDTDLASRRLDLVARVFAAPSRAFLEEHGLPGGALALDVGCGPGHTTRLLRDVLGAERTVGLDASDAFVCAARRDTPAGVCFVRHDVTALPLPTAPADRIYARLLISHLAAPEAAIRGATRWIRAPPPRCSPSTCASSARMTT